MRASCTCLTRLGLLQEIFRREFAQRFFQGRLGLGNDTVVLEQMPRADLGENIAQGQFFHAVNTQVVCQADSSGGFEILEPGEGLIAGFESFHGKGLDCSRATGHTADGRGIGLR